jgi:lipopolysaccharide/colanic/teichoic acid biosynthesis glycosyltransferase/nucleoside-diphosphate-sugar epimerase
MHRRDGREVFAPSGRGGVRPVRSMDSSIYLRFGKRSFDICVSAIGLILLAPFLLLIACAVKFSSRGPVFFRQVRVGRRGAPFKIAKFRTMQDGAESRGPRITSCGDSRITRVGEFLRRHKLDELPQLWNVLAGNMSLVGPRPEVPDYVAFYTCSERAVLSVRPGITGPDSLAYRGEEELLGAARDPVRFYERDILPDKIGLGLQYVKLVTFSRDLRILFDTLKSTIGFSWRRPEFLGAYSVDLSAELLGRDIVELDLEEPRKLIEGHGVLVTGAAGSIGSELCRQLALLGPRKLVCVDKSAAGIFWLQRRMLGLLPSDRFSCVVADVGDSRAMRSCFAQGDIEYVFHAAAYKDLPALESRVAEAVQNNVLALDALLRTGEAAGCRAFLLISSDKAVNPSSVMGATKRIGELMLASSAQGRMRCVTVRFGNVLGSSGSVLPILREQLRKGLALTITHPESKRFFMSSAEAVSLTLEAFAIGGHGEILILDMGAPVKILDLARKLIGLSERGKRSVKIRFIGLRPGEKLEEELFYAYETLERTRRAKIYRTRCVRVDRAQLRDGLAALRENLGSGDVRLRAALAGMVPEYVSADARGPDLAEHGSCVSAPIFEAIHDEAI